MSLKLNMKVESIIKLGVWSITTIMDVEVQNKI